MHRVKPLFLFLLAGLVLFSACDIVDLDVIPVGKARIIVNNNYYTDITIHKGIYTGVDSTPDQSTPVIASGGSFDRFDVDVNDSFNIWFTTSAIISRLEDNYGYLMYFTLEEGKTYELTIEDYTYTFVEIVGDEGDNSQVATPVITPSGGSYDSAQTVTISTSTSGATIYYTIDGSTPNKYDFVYNGSFTLDTTTTVKAFATYSGMTDSAVASETLTITIPVGNQRPIADAGVDLDTLLGDPVTLDASASSDPNGDALNYSWILSIKPSGSSAVLDDDSIANPGFTPDLPGEYQFSLTVDDGELYSDADLVTVVSVTDRIETGVPANIAAAEYDAINDRIVMVSSAPNKLTVFDVETRTFNSLSLAYAPLALSISPDGNYAAVGADNYVLNIDLSSMTISNTYPLSFADTQEQKVSDVVYGGNGKIYFFPREDQWVYHYEIEVSDGTTTKGARLHREGAKALLHPSGNSLYLSDEYDLMRFSIDAQGTLTHEYDSSATNNVQYDAWITEDGQRIISQFGHTVRVTEASGTDLLDLGTLAGFPGNGNIAHADHSTEAQQIAVVKLNSTSSYDPIYANRLYFFSDQDLSAEGNYKLPGFTTGNGHFDGYGRYVFYNTAGDSLFLLVQAEPDTGLLNDYILIEF